MQPLPPYKYPPNPPQFLTPPSPTLSSSSSVSTMVFHRWPFIERGLFGAFQGLYERSMGMEPAPSPVSPPTVKLLICPMASLFLSS